MQKKLRLDKKSHGFSPSGAVTSLNCLIFGYIPSALRMEEPNSSVFVRWWQVRTVIS